MTATALPEEDSGNTKREKYAVLVHGVMRTHRSMRKMERALKKRGYITINFSYNSRRLTIQEAAQLLHEKLDSLEDKPLYFVCHSMGGLITRYYLSRWKPRGARALVMVGTPNHGSELADFWSRFAPFRWLYGPAGLQLRTGDAGFSEKAGIPSIPFGVIAGRKGDGKGYSRIIPGDDDGRVSVESTKLQGMTDFIVLRHHHTFMMRKKDIIENVLHFFEHLRFIQKAGEHGNRDFRLDDTRQLY